MKVIFGRTLNQNTLMWEFQDGSGVPIPDEKMREIRYWMESGLPGGFLNGLGIKSAYEDKYKMQVEGLLELNK
jgi:hypothetical protein